MGCISPSPPGAIPVQQVRALAGQLHLEPLYVYLGDAAVDGHVDLEEGRHAIVSNLEEKLDGPEQFL